LVLVELIPDGTQRAIFSMLFGAGLTGMVTCRILCTPHAVADRFFAYWMESTGLLKTIQPKLYLLIEIGSIQNFSTDQVN